MLSDKAKSECLFCVTLLFPLTVFSIFLCSAHSEDEDDERHSTDPDTRDPKNSKKTLGKIKWSRDEVLFFYLSLYVYVSS